MKTLRKSKGFSLIELLVVIAIIGVLSAVGITAYTGYTASAKEQASRTQFAQMVSLVNAEAAKCGLGSGTYAWGGDCSAAWTGTAVASHMHSNLGMKNPYNNSEAGGTTFANVATIADPTVEGQTKIFANSTQIEIRTLVKTGTTLAQIITKSN